VTLGYLVSKVAVSYVLYIYIFKAHNPLEYNKILPSVVSRTSLKENHLTQIPGTAATFLNR